MTVSTPSSPSIETRHSWQRLAAAGGIGTVGGVGMWSVVVILPAIQAEFGAARADATLPYAASMIGFALGGVAMGRMVDRFGAFRPVFAGIVALALGYVLAAQAASLWQFALIHALLVSFFGGGVMFGPLISAVSLVSTSGAGIAASITSPMVQR